MIVRLASVIAGRFHAVASLIFGMVAAMSLPAEVVAQDRIGEAVCTAVAESQLADACWKRVFSEQCDATVPDRDACLAGLFARRADASLVRRDNFERRGEAIVTTSDLGDGGLEFTASFAAGPGSDVPPMYSELLTLTCRAGLSAVSLGLSRPPTASTVELLLDGRSFPTSGWRQFGDILIVGGDEAEELIAVLRTGNSAVFSVVVSDDPSYKVAFDLRDSEATLWPFDYLCA